METVTEFYPFAEEIAAAIVTACRLHHEDVEGTMNGKVSRARWVAFGALVEKFPDINYRKIAAWVGWHPTGVCRSLGQYKFQLSKGRWKWWRPQHFEVVKQAIDDAGARWGQPAGWAPKDQIVDLPALPPPRAPPPEEEELPVVAAPVEAPLVAKEELKQAKPPPWKTTLKAARKGDVSYPRRMSEIVTCLGTAKLGRDGKRVVDVMATSGYNPDSGASWMRPDKPAAQRGVAVVTASLMGDPPPSHVRAELRKDAGARARDDGWDGIR